MARLARTLVTPRRGIVLLLSAIACLGAVVHLAAADPLDPTKPVPSFTSSPDSPLTGETVTFTSTSEPGVLGGPIDTEEWDLDNDGNFDNGTGAQADRSFATAGTYTVALRVTDTNGASDVATGSVTVQNRPPTAGISISPSSPSTLETITFTSTSTDDDGSIVSYAWDLDNDGNFDNGAVSEVHGSFPLAGSYTVRLLVADNDGATAIATYVVDVGNQPPIASFDYTPTNPSTGDEITLTSRSSDADGSIASYSWDLNGDNSFGDVTGPQTNVTFSTAGDHTVRLRVTDSDGTSSTDTQVIAVANRGPAASFDFSPATPSTGQEVTFTSTATDPDGSIASRAWDLDNDGSFDDGGNATVKKTFASQGTHTVHLRVTDDNGASDLATRTVEVANRGPTAGFDVSPSSPQTGEQVTLTSTSSDPDGSIVSYAWDLNGDDNFSDASDAEVLTTFTTPGNHTVKLAVTDNSGASDVSSVTIAVTNRAPTAAFGYSPASPESGELITFTSSSSDPDGSIASLGWDLDNDGSFDDGAVGTVHGSFSTPGAHTVKLRVTDASGASDTASLTIQVANRGPSASFTSAPDSPTTGQPVTFTSTSTDPDGSVASVAWDLDNDGNFDDGGNATAQRSFATAGTYTVRLRATDSSGATDIATGTVTIANRPPSASFGFSPASPKTGDEVTFDSNSTDPDGSIASYSWDLNGDGTFGDSTAASANHTFATPGLHTVQLQVTDNLGATGVATDTIAIANRPPTASFDIAPVSPTTLEQVSFTSTATDPDGTIAAYAWDLDNDGQFDDGATAQLQHTFPVANTYTIKLMVTDSNGATATATRTVQAANQAPTASFTTSPATPTTDGPVTFTSTSTDPEGLPLTAAWDLDNDGQFDDGTGATVQKTFTAPRSYTFKLRVTDASSASHVATGTITVPNRLPTATVDHDPKNPQTGTAITFTATSNDPENRVKSIAWDDEDEDDLFNDGTGQTLTKTYRKPGGYAVKFRIEDQDGGVTVAEDAVAVGNRAPVADFVVLPQSPVAGAPFTLISTALDPDTALDKWLWDLNGDETYGDAEGASVQHSFPAAGTYTVGLRVLDSEDVADTIRKSVVVHVPASATTTPLLTPSGPSFKLLSPFPVVRLAGRISQAGTRLRLFSIEAPPGARVVVRCKGRSCPFRLSARSAAATDPRTGKVRSSASLRIRQLEKRVLKKGVTITIFVTKSGTIGKYVQFKFLKRRPPARVDRCLMPSAPSKPVECPS